MYCQRGEMENRIKEQQLDLFADRTSCHRFLANQFRLLLSSAAYVLVQALRRTALAGTELARAQVGTIRLRLFKVAARVVVTARRVVFHLASSYPYQAVFREVFERLTSDPAAPARGIGLSGPKTRSRRWPPPGVRGAYTLRNRCAAQPAQDRVEVIDPLTAEVRMNYPA